VSHTLTRSVLIAAVLLLPGCDPAYTLGVRTQLSPAPTASCIEAALRADSGRMVLRSTGSDSAGFVISHIHGRGAGVRSGASLQVDWAGDSAKVLRLQYSWLGTARNVPLADQRQMLSEGSALLAEIRGACAPASPAPVQCFTRGFGGSPACAPPA
jgi:hypothetical protein